MARRQWPQSLPQWLHLRQTHGHQVSDSFCKHCCMTPDLVSRLGLYRELEAHTGCVNCLQWSKTGSLLASGSDDKTITIWDGVTFSKVTRVNTPHEGNIFSVVWMPGTDDSQVVSGAGDCRLAVTDLETGANVRWVAGHQGRVKRLTVAGDCPGLVWSGGEDGAVRQWDTREKWSQDNHNVLVNLNSQVGRVAEVKCVTTCPSRSELLAVGASDPYVRVYDRRMITCAAMDTSLETCDDRSIGAVAYFVPGHLPGAEVKFQRSMRPLASTYITYNADGTELLCNLGGEQVYLYDRWALYSTSTPFNMAVINNPTHCDKLSKTYKNGQNGHCSSYTPSSVKPLSSAVEKVKLEANTQFEAGNYSAAVSLYNQALVQHRSAHPILCGNRAAALMKRGWDGDIYAALRDCLTALSLDPGHIKAHLRLTQCLLQLEWLAEAQNCLDNFSSRHPDFVKSKAFTQLVNDLEKAKEKIKPGKGDSNLKTLPTASSPVLSQYSAADFLRSSSSDEDEDMEEVDMETEDGDGVKESKRFGFFSPDLAGQEVEMRLAARDYSVRYLGSCNTTTDIKEANFLGSNGQYIMAGSDDGHFFIWDRSTANIVKILVGDDNIVNCLQSHPFAPILATSGIESVVKIWQPLPENGECKVEVDMEAAATSNQRRMNADPFETILMGMGYRINADEEQQEDDGEAEGSVQCRPS